MSNINRNAKSQLPVFADAAAKPVPFNERGITGLVPFKMQDDGNTFQLTGMFLDKLPDYFVKGGSEIGHVAESPSVAWLCGPFVPLGNNRFLLALNRTWKNKWGQCSVTPIRAQHIGKPEISRPDASRRLTHKSATHRPCNPPTL